MCTNLLAMETIQITVRSSEGAEALKKLLKSMDFVESVNSTEDPDREAWLKFADANFSAAYGDDEPEYTVDMITKPNPDYSP